MSQNVYECKSLNLPFLFSKIRAVDTEPKEFAFYAMRLMRLIAEDGLALLGGEGKISTNQKADFFHFLILTNQKAGNLEFYF